MGIAAAQVRDITAVCWVVGTGAAALAALVVLLTYTASPRRPHVWGFVGGAAASLVLIACVLLGTGACLLGTWQLSELVCTYGIGMRRQTSTPDSLRATSYFVLGVHFAGAFFALAVWGLVVLARTRRFGAWANGLLRRKRTQ